MILLRILGGLELEGPDGREITRVLAQPKRIALLVYLALAGSFVRRDTLLGLFWPESDTARARGALRQAVRFLRQHLGEETVVNRGEEEIAIAEGVVSCDAVAFRDALARGDQSAAVAIHRGELLPGFYLADAPELERWLETERAQFLRDASSAAIQLVAHAVSNEDGAAAIDFAHQALRWSGDDELVIRRLMATLDSVETRTAALQLYNDFAKRMQSEFGLDPAHETQLLAESIRKQDRKPLEAVERKVAGNAPASSAGLLDPRRILVLQLENRTGDPRLDHIGSMTADWIIQGLSEVAGFEVVSHTAVLSSSRYFERTTSGEEKLRAMAIDQRAGTVVSGVYYTIDEENLQFHVRITEAGSGTVRFAPPPVSAPRMAPLPAIEALREQVRGILAPALAERVTHPAAASPPKYEAYRHYVEGIELFIQGNWSGALERLEQAAATDSGYVLPLLVSAITRWNRGELAEAETLCARVAARRETLRPFEGALLDMVQAWLRGDWVAAREATRRQAQLAPGSIANFGVAEESRRLNRPLEALGILEAMDPARGEMRGWIFYWLELTIALHMLGRHPEELEAATRARELFPEDPSVLLMEVRACAAIGQVAYVHRLIDERLSLAQPRYPDAAALMREAALELRAHGFMEPAEVLFRRSLEWYSGGASGDDSLMRRRAIARALYDAERWDDAREEFTAIVAAKSSDASPDTVHHAQLQTHLDLGYLGALAVRADDRTEAMRIDAQLAAMKSRYLYGRNTWWRAAMAALAGERDRATSLLRQSFSEGMPMEIALHADTHFEGLRGYEPWEQLMRPRG